MRLNRWYENLGEKEQARVFAIILLLPPAFISLLGFFLHLSPTLCLILGNITLPILAIYRIGYAENIWEV